MKRHLTNLRVLYSVTTLYTSITVPALRRAVWYYQKKGVGAYYWDSYGAKMKAVWKRHI